MDREIKIKCACGNELYATPIPYPFELHCAKCERVYKEGEDLIEKDGSLWEFDGDGTLEKMGTIRRLP